MSPWLDQAPAVVHAWYGGQQAGHGLADVLLGSTNPSARLPFTVPAAEDDLPHFERDADHVTYDRWHGWWRAERLGLAPTFPFGFGLSYTTFEIGNVAAVTDGDAVVVHCSVANTGERDGADVVQVYARFAESDTPRRLVGFGRVEVAAGSVVDHVIRVPADRFRQRNVIDHTWVLPAGPIELTVGRHASDAGVVVDVLLPSAG